MVNETEQLSAGDIWDKATDDARRLAISLSVSGGLSQAGDYLEFRAHDKDLGFDLEKAKQELSVFGVLQQISLIQEKRERLLQMKKPPQILLTPITELRGEQLRERFNLDAQITDEVREYLRLSREVKEYEQNREKQPERYRSWEEPRYRLRPDFQAFIEKTFMAN